MNALGKRFAGLPVWAWAAILGGGLVIGLVLRSRSDSADTSATDGADIQDDSGASDYYDSGYDPTDAGYYMSDPGFTLGGAPTYPGAYNLDPNAYADALISAWDAWAEDNNWPNGDGNNPNGTKCTKPKPARKPPKGFQYKCLSGSWVLVGKPGSGRPGGGKDGDGKGDGKGGGKDHGGKHHGNGGGKHRAGRVPLGDVTLTGGGPPNRRNTHRPFRQEVHTADVGRGGRGPGSR